MVIRKLYKVRLRAGDSCRDWYIPGEAGDDMWDAALAVLREFKGTEIVAVELAGQVLSDF
jgi:hypothetical protein